MMISAIIEESLRGCGDRRGHLTLLGQRSRQSFPEGVKTEPSIKENRYFLGEKNSG